MLKTKRKKSLKNSTPAAAAAGVGVFTLCHKVLFATCHALYALTHFILTATFEVVSFIISILQRNKPRLWKVIDLAQGDS